MLGEGRSKDSSGKHQGKDGVEDPAIDQALVRTVEGMKADKCGRECCRHLQQGERMVIRAAELYLNTPPAISAPIVVRKNEWIDG